MKKCTAGLFSKIVTFLVFGIFIVPLTGLFLYLAFFYPRASGEERLIFLGGAAMFGGLLAFAVYRVFYLGLVWVEYDRETVIFHYSRREEYRFRWEEIPGSRVQAGRADGGYVFCIQGNRQQRKIPLNRLSKGYKDFENTLELTGVLHRIGVKTQEEFKRDAEDILEQYSKYCEAYPGAVRAKPEGDCVLCPDCQGRGLHIKRLPLLKVDVGKVCKTCGGSGYLPR